MVISYRMTCGRSLVTWNGGSQRRPPNVDRLDMICEDLGEFIRPLNELIEIVKDRTRWKN